MARDNVPVHTTWNISQRDNSRFRTTLQSAEKKCGRNPSITWQCIKLNKVFSLLSSYFFSVPKYEIPED